MLASVGATMMWLGERVHMGLLPIGSANMRGECFHCSARRVLSFIFAHDYGLMASDQLSLDMRNCNIVPIFPKIDCL